MIRWSVRRVGRAGRPVADRPAVDRLRQHPPRARPHRRRAAPARDRWDQPETPVARQRTRCSRSSRRASPSGSASNCGTRSTRARPARPSPTRSSSTGSACSSWCSSARRSCSARCLPTATCAARSSRGRSTTCSCCCRRPAAMLMAEANDLIVVFLGLEILSIALYVLAGYYQRKPASQEAAIKYFVLGAFSSAFFLYGDRARLRRHRLDEPGRDHQPAARAPVSPTACSSPASRSCSWAWGSRSRRCRSTCGRPTSTRARPRRSTGFMAAGAKAAGFAALLRIFFSTFGPEQLDWQPIVWALAVLTLLVGSVLAIVQTDIKRMLAYSSISHAGYILVGLQAATDRRHRGLALLPARLHLHGARQLRHRDARRAPR